jgi:enoyl-CoA hydratase/carnithine racemase
VTGVLTEIADQVMTITLDGADTLNSLTPATIAGLDDAIDIAEADRTLRAVVVAAAGERAFSVGMDITFLEECFADPSGVFLPFIRSYHRLLQRIEALPVPVIAKVAGLARAGGFELILACDFVVVSDDAKVGDIHLEFGMPPGAGSSQRAPRKLGDQKAKLLMLTPTWLVGQELVDFGVAIACAPRAELDAEVERLLALLRGRSRAGIAITKRLLHAPRDLTFEEGLRYERELFARLHEEVPDAAEGYRAFVEKRAPHWGDADVIALR